MGTILNNIIIITAGFVLLVIFIPRIVQAQGIEITPHIIDEQAKARDILEYDITVKNNKTNHAFVYAVVNDINPEDGKQVFGEPANLDKTASVARWIRISRGMFKIPPGEEIEVPLRIEVNMEAIPGKRHAAIAFVDASNRWEAESQAMGGTATQLLINLDIVEEVVERAQIHEFKTDKNVYFNFPVNSTLAIKNIGNRNIFPKGYIYFYNRRGEEIDKITLEEKTIEPNTVMYYDNSWNSDYGMGKYRVRLEMEYGNKTTRDLQETLYFWIIPGKIIGLVAGGVFLLIVLLSIILFKRTYHFHHPPISVPDGIINLKDKK